MAQHDLENQKGVRGKKATTDKQVVTHEQYIELKHLINSVVEDLYTAISEVGGGGAGSDITAIHDNEANEISAITEKTVIVGPDMLIMEDSESTNAKKMVKMSNLPSGAPATHKDSHDPQDGGDPLDTAIPIEIALVVAGSIGTSHSFSRSDHIHAINHGITDNHLVTVDDVTDPTSQYAKFTAYGLEGKAFADVRSDLDVGDLTSTESISGLWNFMADGNGDLIEYDITIGDVVTPDYGIIRVGNGVLGRTSHTAIDGAPTYNLDGCFIFQNIGGAVTGDLEYGFLDSSGLLRFALPKSGVGNATYNPRSMLIAGPAIADSDIVTVGYWQTEGIFENLACDTATYGADLGVQNNCEIEGDLFIDSIKESTATAGVTIDGLLIKDGVIALSGIPAHKDSHDPQDGSDALDTAAPIEIIGVQSSGAGTSHFLARSDHAHQIQHSIADNHLVTIDSGLIASGEYAKFTTLGLESKTFAEVRGDINVADGADVTATNETSHTDVVVDGDFTADGYLKRYGGSGVYDVQTTPIPVGETAAKCTDANADQTSANTCDTPGGAGTDTTAIHDNVNNEIAVITAKTVPVGDDYLIIEDSEDSADKKALQIKNLPAAAPAAHKDSHDPQDGSDALDTAAPIEIVGVQGSGVGTSHFFTRSDHAHQIQHSIADNHLVTIDGADLASGEITRMTANGIESRSNAEVKTQLGYLTDLSDDTTPTLGGNVDLNAKHFWVDGTAGESLDQYDLVSLQSDGYWDKADADTAALSQHGLGVVTTSGTINVSDPIEVCLFGRVTVDSVVALDEGVQQYVSTIAGNVQNTTPSTTGQTIRLVGFAISTTEVFLNPDGWWELAK